MKSKMILSNFGKFDYHTFQLADLTAPNGFGKTTFVNAYLFCLTGKVKDGFVAKRNGSDVPPSVTIHDLLGYDTIHRYITPKGNTGLSVDGSAKLQVEFVTELASKGIDISLLVACADTNLLTSPDLTSEDLRNFLTTTRSIDSNESDDLRARLKVIKEAKKQAENAIVIGLTEPKKDVEALMDAERGIITYYEKAQNVLASEPSNCCSECNRELSTDLLKARKAARVRAADYIKSQTLVYAKLIEQRDAHASYLYKLEMYNNTVEANKKARSDIQKYIKEEADLSEQIRAADQSAINRELPFGTVVVTENTTKTGKSKNVCTLIVDGIPLKSVNRAERVKLAVELLSYARALQGCTNVYPIIVDNAESVQDFGTVENLIKLTVTPPVGY